MPSASRSTTTSTRCTPSPACVCWLWTGVTPSNDTIASESYPLCNEFYAVLHADAAADSPERQLYDWLDTAAGQDCIKKSGYVAVAPTTAANSAV